MSTPSYKIIIVGGGIGGFSAAVELALKGHSVTVLERTPTLQSIGGALLIPPQASKVIDSWGCHERFLNADEIRKGLMIFRYADGTVIGSNNFGWQKDVYGYQYVLSAWEIMVLIEGQDVEHPKGSVPEDAV